MKRLALLGCTGSIGSNCLDVVARYPESFTIAYLAAHKNVEKLLQQTRKFRPGAVAIVSDTISKPVLASFARLNTAVYSGPDALIRVAQAIDYDLLVNAIVGAAGFLPTYHAIDNGKDIALANKETLVLGGAIIIAAAKKKNIKILPIDSEHSAIFQCLLGEDPRTLRRIILTASGGPFRTWSIDQLKKVTVAQAINHPNWKMGAKITIDSATMMNKGLEVIEAHWLFGVPARQVDVVIHPQSIIHSMVEFTDGSIKAQLGMPDMRIPIQLALTYPNRYPADLPRLDFNALTRLDFEPPDFGKFPCLRLAYQALATGGTAPAVLNAANEVAVSLFLDQKLAFTAIPGMIERALERHTPLSNPGVEELLAADHWARNFVTDMYV